MKRCILILFSSTFILCANAQDFNAQDNSFRLRGDLGFCHWYADDLLTSVNLTHITAGVGMKPKLEFLEIRLRYDLSQIEAQEGSIASPYNSDYIHFISSGLSLCQTFSRGYQQLNVFAGFNAVVPILGDAVSLGGSLGIGMEYLFNVKPESNQSLGIFFEARNQSYTLNLPAGEMMHSQFDLVVDLGFVIVFWQR